MGRKNRRIRGRDTRPLPRDGATLYGLEETEGPSWTHGDIYLVRRIGSARAVKYYVCPGCNQQIVPGWHTLLRGRSIRGVKVKIVGIGTTIAGSVDKQQRCGLHFGSGR